MLYIESYQMIHDWDAEAAESEEVGAEQNAAYLESECEAVALNLYPEFRAVCLSDSGRLPNDVEDAADWHDWLLHEFAFGSEEQEAMGWHIDYGTKFTRISEMEKFFIKEIAA